MDPRILPILGSIRSHRDFDPAIQQLKGLALSEEEMFTSLWPRAISRQKAGAQVAFCAIALYQINPQCGLSAGQAIQQLNQEWDVSLEEVPWYLGKQFTRETLEKAIAEVEQTSGKAEKRLEIVLYWLDKMKP